MAIFDSTTQPPVAIGRAQRRTSVAAAAPAPVLAVGQEARGRGSHLAVGKER